MEGGGGAGQSTGRVLAVAGMMSARTCWVRAVGGSDGGERGRMCEDIVNKLEMAGQATA